MLHKSLLKTVGHLQLLIRGAGLSPGAQPWWGLWPIRLTVCLALGCFFNATEAVRTYLVWGWAGFYLTAWKPALKIIHSPSWLLPCKTTSTQVQTGSQVENPQG